MGVFSEMSIDANYDREFQEDDGVDQIDTKAIPSTTGRDASKGGVPVEDKLSGPPVENNSEEAKRAAHEAEEKERREQWERAKKEKEAREKQALEEIASMDDDSIIRDAMELVTLQGERITRRNMKMCVIEHIKACCKEDPAFAVNAGKKM